ncbi:MAG: thiamine-phosphate kinase, partial [Pseudomonadota bacterium]
LSEAAEGWIAAQDDEAAALAALASGGDDYEILFTAPVSRRRSVEMAANVSKTRVTRIGTVVKGEGVALLAAGGAEITPSIRGHDHFAGR